MCILENSGYNNNCFCQKNKSPKVKECNVDYIELDELSCLLFLESKVTESRFLPFYCENAYLVKYEIEVYYKTCNGRVEKIICESEVIFPRIPRAINIYNMNIDVNSMACQECRNGKLKVKTCVTITNNC